jgi:hypothetical protein
MENMKKSKLNSEMIWKIWKISVLVITTPLRLLILPHPPPPLYMYMHCFSELKRIILEYFFVRDYASRDKIYHFIHLALRNTSENADTLGVLHNNLEHIRKQQTFV